MDDMTPKGWLEKISKAGKLESDWRQAGRDVVDLYRDDERGSGAAEYVVKNTESSFNILHSNTETLKPALYSHTPRPDVRRRFLDEDPIAREATEVLNRGLSFCIDDGNFDETMEDAVQDYLLPGRGVIKEEYKPIFEKEEKRVPAIPDDQGNFDDKVKFDDEGAFTIDMVETLVGEGTESKYVYWEDFRIGNARKWKDVPWVAFAEWMTKEDMKDEFGATAAAAVPMGAIQDPENPNKDARDVDEQARVWQVWCKVTRKVYTVAECYDGYLEKPQDDPLGLAGFFPTPKPLYSIQTNSTLIPRPEYAIYQDQAEELNIVSRRITVLTDALRRRGVYDSGFEELAQLADAGDNEFIPVSDYSSKVLESGGIGALMAEAPIDKIAQVVVGLYQQREQIKSIIYEITGISDIQRGSTKASETLGAQQIKAQFGSLRLDPRQKAVQRFARDVLRLKAEIMSEHFSKSTLEQMTGLTISDEAFELLSTDKDRGFRIDIETDSTIAPDIGAEQKNRIEFLTAVTGFITEVAPLVQGGVLPPETAKQLFMFAIRSFKIPPALEESVEKIGAQNSDEQAAQARMKQQFDQMQAQLDEREQVAAKLEEEARRANDDARVQKANVQVQEEKLLRKMDALKTQEKVVKLVSQIEGLNLSAEIQEAIAEVAESVETDDD